MRSSRRRRRSLAACLLAAASLVILTGCQGAPNANLTREDVMAKAVAHLESKYGRAFQLGGITWGEPWGDPVGLDGKRTVLDAYPVGGDPARPFLVKVDPVASPIAFHDYYVVQLVAPEYEKRAAAAASAVFPGAVAAVYRPGGRGVLPPPDSLGAATTFDQFKAWADTGYDIEFCAAFPLAPGQDPAAVKANVPALVTELNKIAGKGSVVVSAFTPDVFASKVRPTMTDNVRKADCTNGMPVASVELRQSW